mmetsp:Transcript_11509/g.13177  ORF Transcript_11509/g.13177 Transcript_11509/m.13177 type:complete len:300 (+) Transcript_11509:163-1062(+)
MSERAKKAESSLKDEAARIGSPTVLQTIACDLMSFESVRNAATEVNDLVDKAEYSGLDVLVNNAGVFLMADDRTEDGYDITMQVNHLSHFLLTKLLLGSLRKAADVRGEARIVNHSSTARWVGLPLSESYLSPSEKGALGGDLTPFRMNRYHHSKLCNALFTIALHHKFRERGIENVKVLVADPGLAATHIVDNVGLSTGKLREAYLYFAKHFVPFQSAADGAVPLMQCSFGEDSKSGSFYAPARLGMYGEPTLVIQEGKAVETNPIKGFSERYVLDQNQQKLMWLKSEEAVDEKFFSD